MILWRNYSTVSSYTRLYQGYYVQVRCTCICTHRGTYVHICTMHVHMYICSIWFSKNWTQYHLSAILCIRVLLYEVLVQSTIQYYVLYYVLYVRTCAYVARALTHEKKKDRFFSSFINFFCYLLYLIIILTYQ